MMLGAAVALLCGRILHPDVEHCLPNCGAGHSEEVGKVAAAVSLLPQGSPILRALAGLLGGASEGAASGAAGAGSLATAAGAAASEGLKLTFTGTSTEE